ncbi:MULTISPECIES: hypothetical protein [unclassified Streptococcus]|uniref:hypothetical protein n=1 Tax=unclassified Streptococcus TaxID=2608887 RepID=UPI00359E64B2
MGDKIIGGYELLLTELEDCITVLEAVDSDIAPEKAQALLKVATNALKHLVTEHTAVIDEQIKRGDN